MKNAVKIFAILAVAVFAFAVQPAAAQTTVDLELLLLVDVSGSVDGSEFVLQRDGYVNAFNDASVVSAIQGGVNGKIAASLVYWSSSNQQAVAAGWTEISDATSASAFAAAISGFARPFSGLTAIGSALNYGGGTFANNGFDAIRQVIDVSGDGTTNDGIASATGRANALAAGVDTINGIVIGGSASVLSHYTTDVIGGTNAFVLTAATFQDFENSIKSKLIREIKGGVVPEPMTMSLMGSGLLGMIGFRRKKRS